jgi:mRNA-degrading endonuclease RelE of RelBE toxin-antitoxin system
MYEIIIKLRAEKEFAKLPKKLKEKFYIEFKKLAANPLAHPQIKKIKGTKFGWRLRIDRWRILFALFPNEKRIEVVDIFLRKGEEDYRKRRKLIR